MECHRICHCASAPLGASLGEGTLHHVLKSVDICSVIGRTKESLFHADNLERLGAGMCALCYSLPESESFCGANMEP